MIRCAEPTGEGCIDPTESLAEVERQKDHAHRHPVAGSGGTAPRPGSPNQVLTHAARAAAKQLNFQPPLVAARGAREGLWLEQATGNRTLDPRMKKDDLHRSALLIVGSLSAKQLILPCKVWAIS